MSTSVNTNTAASGATNVPISTEVIGGDAIQRIKLITGAVGVDGGDVTTANPLPVTQTSLPLPTGAATEATLSTINGKLPAQGQSVMASSQPVVIASNQTAVPISAASLPLPTGAATEATLSNLNGKIPATVAGSQPVTLRNAAGTAIGSLALATALEGILTSAGATDFFFSTANATTVQLAASATFTGTVESIVSAQAWSIILTTDQPGTLTLIEYIDAGGTRATSTKTISVLANVPLSRCYTANGNYFKLTFQNTGASTTTTLNINTAFGVLPAVTSLGNGPVSLNEVNGTALSLGNATTALSLPVSQSSDSATGSLGALNATVAVPTTSAGTAVIQISGTWVGTVTFESSNDNYVTSQSVAAVFLGGVATQSASWTTNGFYAILTAGFKSTRARMSAYTSGTATIAADAFSPNRITVALQGNPNNLQTLSTLISDTTVGAAASIAALNIDLLTGNASGWYDAALFHSAAIQIVGSAGITAGAIFFEQTNDTTVASAGNIWPVEEDTSLTPTPNIAAITIAASTTRMFRGAITARYVRARVSTAFATANVQAIGVFSQVPFSRLTNTVHQATAANLNVTAAIAGAQTLATVTTVGTVTTCSTLTTLANGQTAHSAASTGSPVRVGGRVVTALDTSLATGDASDLLVTTGQQLVTKDFATSENDWQFACAAGGIVNTTTGVTVKAAGAASIRNFMTSLTLSADALGAATEVIVYDGTTATVLWRTKLQTAGLASQMFTFPTPLRGTAATLMGVATVTASVTGGVIFSCQGYQSF